jgi:hypothetical protein
MWLARHVADVRQEAKGRLTWRGFLVLSPAMSSATSREIAIATAAARACSLSSTSQNSNNNNIN